MRGYLDAELHESAILDEEQFRFARNCSCQFVRSQFQVAIANDRAKGRRLTAVEVADAFGVDFLRDVINESSVPLARERNSVGNSISNRRNILGISVGGLAAASGVALEDVENLENGVGQMPIRKLEKICINLGMDERRIGFSNKYPLDSPKIRLRYFSEKKGDEHCFTEELVAKITPSVWKSARYRSLRSIQAFDSRCSNRGGEEGWRIFIQEVKARDYSYPTVDKGSALAQLAREALGVGDTEPVPDLIGLVKEKIDALISYVEWPAEYAGATLSENRERSIVVNNLGMNRWVNTFRFTLAHEIGHILFDQDNFLNDLTVVEVPQISSGEKPKRDLPEMRANSFAAEFLLPLKAVRSVIEQESYREDWVGYVLERLQNEYGVSLPAARFRLKSAGVDNVESAEANSFNSPVDQSKLVDDFVDSVTKLYKSSLIHEDTFLSLTSEARSGPVQTQLI